MKQIIIPLLAILAVTFSGESQAKIRKHNIENPQVKAAYENYLGEPLSERAEHLLHTDQHAWSMPGER